MSLEKRRGVHASVFAPVPNGGLDPALAIGPIQCPTTGSVANGKRRKITGAYPTVQRCTCRSAGWSQGNSDRWSDVRYSFPTFFCRFSSLSGVPRPCRRIHLKRIGSYFSSKDSQSGALFQGLWSKWAGWAYLVPLVPMLEMPKVAEICPLQIGHINRPEIPSLDHPAPPPKQQHFTTFGFFRPI